MFVKHYSHDGRINPSGEYYVLNGQFMANEDFSGNFPDGAHPVVFCVPAYAPLPEGNSCWKNPNRRFPSIFWIPDNKKIWMGYPGELRSLDFPWNYYKHLKNNAGCFEMIVEIECNIDS